MTTTTQIGLHDCIAKLSEREEWVPAGREVRLGPRMLALVQWLDSSFVTLALEAGARQLMVPQLIERSVLERAGYFDSFSRTTVLEESGGQCVPPATCYHCYAKLAAATIQGNSAWSCIARCHRNEEKQEAGRLQEFTMREVVLAGSAAWVRSRRQDWMDSILALAQSMGMNVEIEPATDPFFSGGEARGRKLLQQVKQLKYELRARVDTGGTQLAISSFNLHETFFSRRFGFHLPDGSDAYSGCIAFGLERWALALALTLGPDSAFRLVQQEHP
jgi:seryl-tRNA synthetase